MTSRGAITEVAGASIIGAAIGAFTKTGWGKGATIGALAGLGLATVSWLADSASESDSTGQVHGLRPDIFG